MIKTKIQTCGDCGVAEGEYHADGCDHAICPYCGRQLISCDCIYTLVGIEKVWNPNSCLNQIPEPYYSQGSRAFTDAQLDLFDSLMENVDDIPFFQFPTMCDNCGKLWPEMFMVPNDEWLSTMGLNTDMFLCRECYDSVKALITTRLNPNKVVYPHLCVKCGSKTNLLPIPYEEHSWLRAYAKYWSWDEHNMICKDCLKFIETQLDH